MSRQSDIPTLDIEMLASSVRERYPSVETVVLTKNIGSGFRATVYVFHILRQMYALATSKVAVLDSYCIPVSVLNHKDGLKVIQMWHAIGLLKKAGLSSLGKAEGRGIRVARAMKMHRGYDHILVSAERCKRSLGEVFGYPVEKMIVRPLPRVDALRDESVAEKKRQEIFACYPQMAQRENILYAPTFRKDESVLQRKLDELSAAVDYGRYNLIVKPHPLSRLEIRDGRVIADSRFSGMDMLFAADHVITDYSSILYEALVARKPVYYYAFDFEEYAENRGWFIDYKAEIPGELHSEGAAVVRDIERNGFDDCRAEKFLKTYVEIPDTSCTGRITDLIGEYLFNTDAS
jgi:CDP-ribitol ribitolphosphotransferase